MKMIGGHSIPRSLGPFHYHERVLRENVIPADIRELRFIVEAIQIDVNYHRFGRFVSVDKRIRGARDGLLDAVTKANRLSERGFPSPELARQRNHDWCFAVGPKVGAPLPQLGFIEGEMTSRGFSREHVMMRAQLTLDPNAGERTA